MHCTKGSFLVLLISSEMISVNSFELREKIFKNVIKTILEIVVLLNGLT